MIFPVTDQKQLFFGINVHLGIRVDKKSEVNILGIEMGEPGSGQATHATEKEMEKI